ncbi:MAG TPA: polyphosphate kinase 1 [Anaerolineaceae bacterium]|nr:polyphosphate kinase 1 [Anaerolineaceae bacterium]
MEKKKDAPAPETGFRILNRELSLLDFQARVLEEAADNRNPPLERLKFLSIFGSNMDEFFMVRVSGIKKLKRGRYPDLSPDGLTPREQLRLIRKRAIILYREAHFLYRGEIQPALDSAGVHILQYEKLNESQRAAADDYYKRVVFPALTPLVLDKAHPFPHVSNLSLNLAVIINGSKSNERFARVKVPETLPRFVPLGIPAASTGKETIQPHQYFTWLDQVIAANLSTLFPGMEVIEFHPFRVVRDADIEIQQLEADDLLQAMERTLQKRKFGSVVKIAVHRSMPKRVRKLLVENLAARNSDLYEDRGTLGMSSLAEIYKAVDRPDLKYPPHTPSIPSTLLEMQTPAEIFAHIRAEDILLHHPYDSFSPVQSYLQAAAQDPDVLAIKQTLYRVGNDSPVVHSLLAAAQAGKQVAVLVELKARFDEESNISWARALEKAGAHVIYGVEGLKTHCKIALVVRREGDATRRYLHLSTGNYNTVTANAYEDIGMFTCDENLAADASDLFNYLTGYSKMRDYRQLLVAPFNLRAKLEDFIRTEIAFARAGSDGHIVIKVNALTDPKMIRLLYEASNAGVKIDLIVRGMCCLVPGVPGMSGNIRVVSILGRYLEHSRIFYFANGGNEQLYLGSADLMTRNLDHRVEILFPVADPGQVRYLRDVVLETCLRDNDSARDLTAQGDYLRLQPSSEYPLINLQQSLMYSRVCSPRAYNSYNQTSSED